MERFLIITGGSIDFKTVSGFLENNKYDKVIAVDGGMSAARKMNIVPDYCVGDFDTVSKDDYNYFKQFKTIKWEVHVPEKDETDTELAITLAIKNKADSIYIFGATGSRMDHTLASIGLLMIPLKAGVDCVIIDSNNRIRMFCDKIYLKKSETFGKYISLIPYTDSVKGVSIKGLKYALENYDFTLGNSLGISNEIVDEEAFISIREGIMILIESKD